MWSVNDSGFGIVRNAIADAVAVGGSDHSRPRSETAFLMTEIPKTQFIRRSMKCRKVVNKCVADTWKY